MTTAVNDKSGKSAGGSAVRGTADDAASPVREINGPGAVAILIYLGLRGLLLGALAATGRAFWRPFFIVGAVVSVIGLVAAPGKQCLRTAEELRTSEQTQAGVGEEYE